MQNGQNYPQRILPIDLGVKFIAVFLCLWKVASGRVCEWASGRVGEWITYYALRDNNFRG